MLWCHYDRGHGSVTVCVCVTLKSIMCVLLVDSGFTSMNLMHTACYHRGRMCDCIHVACVDRCVSL